jgi:hypothetical protein
MQIRVQLVRFYVLTAASTKMTVFWDAAPCSLVLKMEAVSTSERSINFYHTTRRNIPENSRPLFAVVSSNRKRWLEWMWRVFDWNSKGRTICGDPPLDPTFSGARLRLRNVTTSGSHATIRRNWMELMNQRLLSLLVPRRAALVLRAPARRFSPPPSPNDQFSWQPEGVHFALKQP